MKKLILFAAALIFCLSMVIVGQTRADSGFCYTCSSGSSCQYCRSGSGKDTSADRKSCESKGCKISGTASCPTAANYKVCN